MAMRELSKSEIKKIVKEILSVTNDITIRDTMKLQDIYTIVEVIKGGKLTKREKLIIAGLISRKYPLCRKVENKQLSVLILV